MGYKNIVLSKDDGIGILTLNRPEKLNALTSDMLSEMLEAYEAVKRDEDIRVLIITGAGDQGFCVGADLDRCNEGKIDPLLLRAARGSDIDPVGTHTIRIREIDKPVIAAVNGVAVGAGFAIALACDIRIASDRSRFGAVFVQRSLLCNEGSTYYLTELVGPEKALELMYTGEIIDAEEAARIGLVSKVVSHDDLISEAKRLGRKIASAPPMFLAFTKRAVYQAARKDLKAQLIYEAFSWNVLLETEDFQEGVNAFLEKRSPVYRGK